MKDSKDYSKLRKEQEEQKESLGFEMVSMPMSEIRSESDLLTERIENDLVAVGEFNAGDLIQNSVSKENFMLKEEVETANLK